MPYVLHHANTKQIYTCALVNHYQLVYYGVKFWDSREEAEQHYRSFLAEQGVELAEAWEIFELQEGQMKICNVKLKNNPALQLYWSEEGKAEVKQA
jgi:hypothetical protein